MGKGTPPPASAKTGPKRVGNSRSARAMAVVFLAAVGRILNRTGQPAGRAEAKKGQELKSILPKIRTAHFKHLDT
jgi:hypothetical protein